MNSKEVFQLAQDKGYIFHFPSWATYTGNDSVQDEWVVIELTLIQKWLREKHNIILWVYPRYFTALVFEYSIMKIAQQYEPFNSYEDALFEGINEALKLIP